MCTSHKLGVIYSHSLNLHHLMMKPHVTLVRFVILCVLFCVVNSIIGHCKKLVVRPFLWQMATASLNACVCRLWGLPLCVNYEDSTSIVPYGGQNWTQNWTKLFFFFTSAKHERNNPTTDMQLLFWSSGLGFLGTKLLIINLGHACTSRVTVVVLCVCLSVCVSIFSILPSCAFRRPTRGISSYSAENAAKIKSHFL